MNLGWLLLLLCFGVAACARSNPTTSDDARPGDDGGAIDASIDGAIAATPRSGAELVSAAGRVRGGTVTMDVELGHWVEQGTATAGSRRLVGAAVVYP
jgi:hypothetical protein